MSSPKDLTPTTKLAEAEREFLHQVHSRQKLPLASKEIERARAACRRMGLCTFDRQNNRWTLTPLGRATLVAQTGQTATAEATPARPSQPAKPSMVNAGLMRDIVLQYTNWQGEFGIRRVHPVGLLWGVNEWHIEPQWLLEAWDLDKKVMRTFALLKISAIEAVKKGARNAPA